MLKDLLEKFDKELRASLNQLIAYGVNAPEKEAKEQFEYEVKRLKSIFTESQQSNLERLIDNCGDRFGELVRLYKEDTDEVVWLALDFPALHIRKTLKILEGTIQAEGKTPTEAVENLIKALEK